MFLLIAGVGYVCVLLAVINDSYKTYKNEMEYYNKKN
jgi:hypothetical protein